jgi:hypothetical protein
MRQNNEIYTKGFELYSKVNGKLLNYNHCFSRSVEDGLLGRGEVAKRVKTEIS